VRIALLSRNAKLHSTARIVEAARARGHEVEVIDPIACSVVIARFQHRLFARGR